MSRITHADLDAFLRDLLDNEGEVDREALRLALQRNDLRIVPVDEGDLMDRIRENTQKVRVGTGPLVDGVLIDDLTVY